MTGKAKKSAISRYKYGMMAAFAFAMTVPATAGDVPTPDRPETGKQGETLPGEAQILPLAYSTGVDVIGHNAIAGRTGNVTMAWSGHCAYVADGLTIKPDGNLSFMPIGPLSGVAVIDVRNPAKPQTLRYLTDKGALNATETVHVAGPRSRPILAASTYGGVEGMSVPKEGWLSLYDVSRCDRPKLLAEVKWPDPVHTLRVSPSGRFVYGAILNPFSGKGGIAVMDISKPKAPRFVGRFGVTHADGSSHQFAPHELIFSPDEKRIYVGVVASAGGDLNRHFTNTRPGIPSAESVGPDAGGIYIIDNSDFVDRKPDPKFRLISTAHKAGWHSPAMARFGGKRHLVNAGELGACPGAWPRFTDISDEANPKAAGEFRLAMNNPENCPSPTGMEKATGGLVGRAGVASTHFQDVDSAENTRLGLFPFLFAGLRIADLRDPASPKEVAYFKPGDPCMSHVHFDRSTGNIWFACNASGFWVVRLKSDVQASLDLPPQSKRR